MQLLGICEIHSQIINSLNNI